MEGALAHVCAKAGPRPEPEVFNKQVELRPENERGASRSSTFEDRVE